MRKIRISFIVFLFILLIPAQKCVADTLGQDVKPGNKAGLLYDMLYKTDDSVQMLSILHEIEALAKIVNDKVAIIRAYDRAGVIKRNQSRYFEALNFHKKALEIANAMDNKVLQIQTLNNIGVVYRRLDEFRLALDFHLKALKMAELLHDKKNICISVNSIGNIYLSLNQYDEALKCFNRALPLEKERANLLGVAINLNNIGIVYKSKKDFTRALEYFNQSLQCNLQLKNHNGEAICYNAIGDIYVLKNEYQKASGYYQKALDLHLQTNDLIYISTSYNNLAHVFLEEKNFKKAIDYYLKALEIALKIGSKSHAQVSYEGLSEGYMQLGFYDKALYFFKESVCFADSIMNEENIRQVNLIHTQYETERNLQQIKLLEKEKQTSRLTSIIGAVVLGLIIIVLVFSYYSIRQKRKIDRQNLDLVEQRIRELEKDRQLLASHAVIQGEETERQRMARDLHDGLGGMLSAVKLQLSSLKGKFMVPFEKAEQFEKALFMLDNSIRELRNVAHNMMPDALLKFGLKDALQDFCSKMDPSQSLKVNFQFFGENQRLDKSLEIALFRISQELINNGIKHAKATEMIIQLLYDNHRVHLTVQDNGIGFDPNDIDVRKSTGLQNIKARVESFNGRLDVSSDIGKGSEIGVEFSISSKLSTFNK